MNQYLYLQKFFFPYHYILDTVGIIISFYTKINWKSFINKGPYDVQRVENEADYVSTIQVEPPVTDFDKREKRSTPTTNYVETLAVIDYALYSRYIVLLK